MPTVTPTVDNVRSRVRLDVDFTDVDNPYALIQRVDATTGLATNVRTHGVTTGIGTTVYSNMYAGYKAVLYDHELPMDTSCYYTATAPGATLNVNTDWSGGYLDPWNSNTPATFTIVPINATSYRAQLYGTGALASPQAASELIPCTQGAVMTLTATFQLVGATNTCGITIQFLDGTGVTVLGSATNISSRTAGFYPGVTVTGTAPASTVYAQAVFSLSGTPATTTGLLMTSAVVSVPAATATSTPVLLSSLGACWLKDPLQPANSVRVDLCFDPNPLCTPSEGVFFQSLDTETMPANSASFNVNNQAEPIIVSKSRSSDTSTLTLVSRTFPDRDRLRTLLTPGTPLLWQVPDEYGSPDRYMSVGNATISRVLPDHRIPVRVFGLPFVVTKAPGGPSGGALGARWQDTCNQFASWGAVNSAGKTWTNVLDGGIG